MATELLAPALGARRCSRSASATPSSGSRRLRGLPADNDAILVVPAGSSGTTTTAPTPRPCSASTTSSSRPQAATIRVPDEFKGAQLADLFGGNGFPKIADDGTLTLTLGSRDFFWLRLRAGSARG